MDNKSAITVPEGLELMGNLKHMERRYAWLQHMVRRRKFVLKYIPTTEQPADFLTKALHFSAFNRCSVAIGQVRLADVGDGDNCAAVGDVHFCTAGAVTACYVWGANRGRVFSMEYCRVGWRPKSARRPSSAGKVDEVAVNLHRTFMGLEPTTRELDSTGTGGASSRGAGAGGVGAVGASTEETGAGGTTTAAPTSPPHRYDTRLQALRRLERVEQERLEQERQELQQRCPPRARPSSPFDDLRTLLFRSSPRRALLVSVLPSPPKSSLTVSSHPITDYYRGARPVVTCVLASLVTDPRASLSSVLALTAAVTDFAFTRRLDYATRMVAAPSPRPLFVRGGSALGCDVLEDRQFELEFLAAASPSLCAMLLSPEGDLDALDIPTPRTYREAVLREWASQWEEAMDSELASWKSTGTYVDAVPPPRANVIDGMWLFKVKRSTRSPPVFKAHYVARGFSQREGVDFFHTFAPTPKLTTLRVLLHVAAQQDYELHSLDFSIAFLQDRLHKEI
ncbi:unnamed protein product [Closterium sp. NIES-53]